MNKYGFYIRKLILKGGNVEDVSVEFSTGLNVISGPSDTGKSYIFECINYMLGSSTEPKNIDESVDYSAVFMEIVLYSGNSLTFKRKFGENEVDIYDGPIEKCETLSPTKVKIKHNKEKTNNLSAVLLTQSGFIHPSTIITNKETPKVRTLSFRDLPNYISISEDKIIKTESPILSGQFSKSTVEKSIFKLFITGNDESEKNVNKEKKGASLSKLEGQKELIERLIHQKEKELLSLSSIEIASINFFDIDSEMEKIKNELNTINQAIFTQTQLRRTLWNQIEEDKSKCIALSELIKRFNLLQQQYETDLERLKFIREGNFYFSQLSLALCPFCNKNLEGASCVVDKCGFNNLENNSLFEAAEAEIGKINLHLSDLASTIEENEYEYELLINRIKENETKYANVIEELNQTLKPQETNLKTLLDKYIVERDNTTKYNLKLTQIEDLETEKQLIEVKLKKSPNEGFVEVEDEKGLILQAYKEFCSYMENLLKRWHFSENPTVNIDINKGFLYVDSKSTKDYGKGYRAIIYSAFAISLMEYCHDNNLPHPGFVVLDSPLTTYKSKKKKTKEDVKLDIQTAFFEDLSNLASNEQVIILENKEPNEEVKGKIRYIEFTKDETEGRYGFFPKK
jgi:hypothetical protein